MIYLLDTNTVSYIVRGHSASARARLAGLRLPQIAAISSITEAEIRYGLARHRRSETFRAAIDLFLFRIRIFPWGSAEALAYGDLRASMESAGKPLGNMDMLIAAHALSLGATLVSNDRAFRQVKTLRGLENWATDI